MKKRTALVLSLTILTATALQFTAAHANSLSTTTKVMIATGIVTKPMALSNLANYSNGLDVVAGSVNLRKSPTRYVDAKLKLQQMNAEVISQLGYFQYVPNSEKLIANLSGVSSQVIARLNVAEKARIRHDRITESAQKALIIESVAEASRQIGSAIKEVKASK